MTGFYFKSIHISGCKVLHNIKRHKFYTFSSKMLHINASKSVHICTFATITVHMCTITVALAFNILIIFCLSLSLLLSLSPYSPLLPITLFFLNSRDLSDLSPWLTEWYCRSSIRYSSEPKWCCRSNILHLHPNHSKTQILKNSR